MSTSDDSQRAGGTYVVENRLSAGGRLGRVLTGEVLMIAEMSTQTCKERHVCRLTRPSTLVILPHINARTSTTNIILTTCNWLLLPVRLALSLESTSQFFPSASFHPLRLCPARSCSYHIFSLCQLTTLTIHNSRSLSLPPQNLPLSQIFPTVDSLPASGLTQRTSRPDRFFWASPFFVFSLFIILLCLVPCGRLSWLFVSF